MTIAQLPQMPARQTKSNCSDGSCFSRISESAMNSVMPSRLRELVGLHARHVGRVLRVAAQRRAAGPSEPVGGAFRSWSTLTLATVGSVTSVHLSLAFPGELRLRRAVAGLASGNGLVDALVAAAQRRRQQVVVRHQRVLHARSGRRCARLDRVDLRLPRRRCPGGRCSPSRRSRASPGGSSIRFDVERLVVKRGQRRRLPSTWRACA